MLWKELFICLVLVLMTPLGLCVFVVSLLFQGLDAALDKLSEFYVGVHKLLLGEVGNGY